MQADSLTQIREELTQKLPPGGINILNTRLILKTGINIVEIDAAFDRDPEKIAAALQFFASVGMDLS